MQKIRSNQAQDGATRQNKSESSSKYERLKDATFPRAIMVLPHVLSLINTMLMSPEEAAIEAARTGQSRWLRDIIHRFEGCGIKEAFLIAAGSGQVVVVADLYTYIDPICEDEVPDTIELVFKAVRRAARGGHSKVIEFLLSDEDDLLFKPNRGALLRKLTPALENAAAEGYLDIVKFMITHGSLKNYKWACIRWGRGDALALAIYHKHDDVVEFLFSVFEDFHWNLKSALIAAVHAEGKDIIKRIYELYPT
ncbi:hypothetical protein F442_08920, partial [Phytophthora nicotianae P10297]